MGRTEVEARTDLQCTPIFLFLALEFMFFASSQRLPLKQTNS
jgi:hypothetical protein